MARSRSFRVEFSCGHAGDYIADRRDRAEFLAARGLCPECESKRLADETERAAAANAAAGLPALRGSPKQIAWAERIREKSIPEINRLCDQMVQRDEIKKEPGGPACVEAARRAMVEQTQASRWIDQRCDLQKAIQALAESLFADGLPIDAPPPAVALQVIKPEGADRGRGLVSIIEVHDVGVTLVHEERNERVVKVAKAFGMHWEDGRWRLTAHQVTGTSRNLAAELAHRLLKAGIPVQVSDEGVYDLVVHASYTPRHWRWVCCHTPTQQITINTAPGDDLDEVIRSLPGARWNRAHRCVVIPARAFDAIEDFAERYEFRISDAARQQMAAARKEMAAAVHVSPRAPRQAPIAGDTATPTLQAKQTPVDPSLVDDEG